MTTAGTTDAPLEIFGGLVSDMSAADLPAGVSFDCQDVKFVPGSVQTRPGLLSIFTPIAGNPAVNYLKTYVPPTGLLRLLALDAAGSLWKESSVGVLSLIQSGLVANSFGKSTSLFTREYLAIGDGKFGIDIPRQFDDTNFDRVSQVGPGAPPSATDEAVSQATTTESQPATVAIVASPNGATENGFLVTITTTGAHGLVANQGVVVAGVTVTGYNNGGTNPAFFTILSVPSPTTFTYTLGVSGLANSGAGTAQSTLATYNFASAHGLVVGQLVTTSGITPAGYNVTSQAVFSVPSSTSITLNLAVAGLGAGGAGTAANAGSISSGVHKITVAFQTRQGAIFVCPVTAQWTASGNKRVAVTSIPTGPSNVTARILLFTLTGQASFFYSSGITGVFSSSFIIQDNSTTGTVVDFTDLGLAASINGDYLFRLVELGECSWVIDYSSRLFWGGERSKIQNVNNLTFDGGTVPIGGGANPGKPLGWTGTANFAGGGIGTASVWGGAYNILGDGATAIRGQITQSMFQDTNGVAIVQPNTAYSVRARIANSTGVTFTQGTLHINMQSTIGGFTTTGISLAASSFGSSFTEIIATILTAQNPVPSDLLLQVYMDGTPTLGASLNIDCIEIFPTNQPFNKSLVRASQVEGPENYDGINGIMLVNENDGYAVRSAFVIRENLYFVKEHGIYVTQDNGTTEPSQWKFTEVSRKVGTPSVNGVAVGEDWAVIAHRTGLYITDGGEPMKISQEIQPTWDSINWSAGNTLWVQIDLQAKRILVGVPTGAATSPNQILMLDYRGIPTPNEIASASPIHTTYTGKLIVMERSRKWSPWTITANSAAVVERFDGTQKVFFGNGVGNGKIYQLTDTQLGTDDGAAIPSYYTTYFHFSHDLEQAMQLGSHNKLYTYLAQFVEGSGSLVVSAVPPGGTAYVIASVVLSNPGLQDIELPINVRATRAAFKVAPATGVGNWFRLARFITNAEIDPSAPVRGWN